MNNFHDQKKDVLFRKDLWGPRRAVPVGSGKRSWNGKAPATKMTGSVFVSRSERPERNTFVSYEQRTTRKGES